MNKTLKTWFERLEYMRKKRELKQAFRRKPRPAKVIIPDEDIPNDSKENK